MLLCSFCLSDAEVDRGSQTMDTATPSCNGRKQEQQKESDGLYAPLHRFQCNVQRFSWIVVPRNNPV